MDLSKPYEIRPAANGGVVVSEINGPGYMPGATAAFTTPADMLAWLAEQYGVKSTVEVVVSGDPSIFRYADEIIKRASDKVVDEYLCTGSSNLEGQPKTDDGTWIAHDGSDMLKTNHGRPVTILMRDGTKRAGKTCDDAARWAWKYSIPRTDQDVVCYRYI